MQELPITPKQMAEFMKLARTDAGKKILNLLQRDHGPALRSALDQKDYEAAKNIVKDFLDRPDVKALMQQLGGALDGGY